MPTLPRKFTDYPSAASVYRSAKVHPVCVDLWKRNRLSRGSDTFIGMTDTRDWTFYLAPCFGVSLDDQKRVKSTVDARFPGDKIRANQDLVRTYAQADLSSIITNVLVASTATGGTTPVSLATLEAAYGRGNMVLVQLADDSDKGFDGRSHAALTAWVSRHAGITLPAGGASALKNNALGFAVQKDASGYYIRFSSSLNEVWGQGQLTKTGTAVDRMPLQNVSRTFEHRPITGDSTQDARRLGYEATRELRDLPKEWAQFFELILARDLKLSLINAGAKFDRIVSRGITGASSKMRRFDVIDPDAHLAARAPGTETTGHRMV